jgi:structural maintenance of chromosome 3 (chondroitin sulfate proteoglycan 6)
LEETALKQDQIQDLIKTIEERLKELQEEKKDLTDYRKKDRERRCLEYAFYSKELESVVSYLDNLEKSHQDNVVEYASRSRLLNDTDIKLNVTLY